jgi:hypothetical protein
MKRLVALGMAIGGLAGLCTVLAPSVTAICAWKGPLVVWIGIAAWATFYAVGDVIEMALPSRRAAAPLPSTVTA